MRLLSTLEKYADMNVLVPHTGGLDSTALIYALKAIGANVTTLAVEGYVTKRDGAEDRVRTRQMELVHFPQRSITVAHSTFHLNRYFKLSVTPVLLGSIVQLIDKDTDYICFGYVLGDQAISYLDDYKKIWSGFGGLLNEGATMPELTTPMFKLHKAEVRMLMLEALEVLELPAKYAKLTWSCETPIDGAVQPKQCGKCDSCIRQSNDLCTTHEELKGEFITFFDSPADYETVMGSMSGYTKYGYISTGSSDKFKVCSYNDNDDVIEHGVIKLPYGVSYADSDVIDAAKERAKRDGDLFDYKMYFPFGIIQCEVDGEVLLN